MVCGAPARKEGTRCVLRALSWAGLGKLHHVLAAQGQKLPSTNGKHTVLPICGLLLSVRQSGSVSCHFCWNRELAFPPQPAGYQPGFSWVLVEVCAPFRGVTGGEAPSRPARRQAPLTQSCSSGGPEGRSPAETRQILLAEGEGNDRVCQHLSRCVRD